MTDANPTCPFNALFDHNRAPPLATWKGIAAKLRQHADRQGANKDYATAADNAMMAEMMELCAADLEKSLSLYTIEEVEGSPPDEPKRKTRKNASPASATDASDSLPESASQKQN